MTVRIEKNGSVWTVIHSRYEARNAMDPKSARELFEAFAEFDADADASVAVFWGEGGAFCAGWDLKNAAALSDDDDGVSTLSFDRTTEGWPLACPNGAESYAALEAGDCSGLLGRQLLVVWSWRCGPTFG